MALWLLMCAGACRAQATGSVGIVSDYRYRGISLSDEAPALQLQVDRDFAGGAYAGLMLSSVRVHDVAGVQWLPYTGIVRERNGLRWEAGVQYHGFTVRGLDFVQWFAGVGGERVQARLQYAPHYFGAVPAWYFELDARQRLSERWRLLGHAGVSRVGSHQDDQDEDRIRSDLRIGVGTTWRAVDVQLAWVYACCAEDYRGGYGYPAPDRQAWIVQLAHRW